MKAYALTGYCEPQDSERFIKELQYILAHPLEKLPPVEKERCYDPAGLKSQPRKAESELKHPRQKQFTCPFCKWSTGYYYAKFHDETRGGCVLLNLSKRNSDLLSSLELFSSRANQKLDLCIR